jgi:C1A family cysteine protease
MFLIKKYKYYIALYNIMFLRFLTFIVFFSSSLAIPCLLQEFENWITNFKIKIANEEHFNSVFSKWTDNHKYIESINAKNLSYKLGHNQFSGMDTSDFRAYLGLNENLNKVETNSTTVVSPNLKLASSVDWVTAGAVTPVKDQGQCGSCWSFSTTGALEGAFFIKYGVLDSFSEQQLVDCDNLKNGGKNLGCNGGVMDSAFSWISKKGGLCSEESYPYTSGDTKKSGTCEKTCSLVSKSVIKSYVDVTVKSDTAMMTALILQPVSIAIEADQKDFQLYKSGVFTGTCGTDLDHGVLAVGYGTLDGLDYYKVKNSWSTSWGDGGYILLGRGSEYNSGSGQCGILMQASYPVL